MHDMGIIQGIVDAVLENAKGQAVKEIELDIAIGALKHVHGANVKFWVEEMLKKEFGEKLKVKLNVETTHPEIKCGCGFNGKVEDFEVTHDMAHLGLYEMSCPKCGSKDYEIVKGNGAEIKGMRFS